jgi:hypothetical protein
MVTRGGISGCCGVGCASSGSGRWTDRGTTDDLDPRWKSAFRFTHSPTDRRSVLRGGVTRRPVPGGRLNELHRLQLRRCSIRPLAWGVRANIARRDRWRRDGWNRRSETQLRCRVEASLELDGSHGLPLRPLEPTGECVVESGGRLGGRGGRVEKPGHQRPLIRGQRSELGEQLEDVRGAEGGETGMPLKPVVQPMFGGNGTPRISAVAIGCRPLGVQEVVGSNPAGPTQLPLVLQQFRTPCHGLDRPWQGTPGRKLPPTDRSSPSGTEWPRHAPPSQALVSSVPQRLVRRDRRPVGAARRPPARLPATGQV